MPDRKTDRTITEEAIRTNRQKPIPGFFPEAPDHTAPPPTRRPGETHTRQVREQKQEEEGARD